MYLTLTDDNNDSNSINLIPLNILKMKVVMSIYSSDILNKDLSFIFFIFYQEVIYYSYTEY